MIYQYYYNDNYLMHWGRSKRDGAKIGSGRYPLGSGKYYDKNGKLTEAGKKRMAKLKRKMDKIDPSHKYKESRHVHKAPVHKEDARRKYLMSKKTSELSADELKEAYDRLKKEKDYNDLVAQLTPPREKTIKDYIKESAKRSVDDFFKGGKNGKGMASQLMDWGMKELSKQVKLAEDTDKKEKERAESIRINKIYNDIQKAKNRSEKMKIINKLDDNTLKAISTRMGTVNSVLSGKGEKNNEKNKDKNN